MSPGDWSAKTIMNRQPEKWRAGTEDPSRKVVLALRIFLDRSPVSWNNKVWQCTGALPPFTTTCDDIFMSLSTSGSQWIHLYTFYTQRPIGDPYLHIDVAGIHTPRTSRTNQKNWYQIELAGTGPGLSVIMNHIVLKKIGFPIYASISRWYISP